MRGMELLQQMSLADPAFVEAADAARGKSRRARPHWAAAACLCLLLGGLAAAALLPASPPAEDPTPAMEGQHSAESAEQTEGPWQPWQAHFNQAEEMLVMDASRCYAEGYFTEELSEAELAAIEPGMRQEWMEYSGYAGFSKEGKLLELQLWISTSQPELSISLQIGQGALGRDYILPGEPQSSPCGAVEYTVLQWENGDSIFLDAQAEIEGEDFFFSLECSPTQLEQAKEDFSRVLECFSCYDEYRPLELSAIQPQQIPEFRNESLTLEQARQDADFGAFLPPQLPQGFSQESIRRYVDQNVDSLSGLWTRGYDQLSWKLSFFSEADEARLTSPAEKENYDLSLYPIPRADSVPEELRQIVDMPIFPAEELSLEALLARSYQPGEAGDSSGPRMEFAVRYGEILLELRTKGIEAEWLYQQLLELAGE